MKKNSSQTLMLKDITAQQYRDVILTSVFVERLQKEDLKRIDYLFLKAGRFHCFAEVESITYKFIDMPEPYVECSLKLGARFKRGDTTNSAFSLTNFESPFNREDFKDLFEKGKLSERELYQDAPKCEEFNLDISEALAGLSEKYGVPKRNITISIVGS